MKIKKLFSWKDIERILGTTKKQWEKYAKRIDVYADCIEISLVDSAAREGIQNCLQMFFENRYDKKSDVIHLELGEELNIDYAVEDGVYERRKLPLFKEMFYQDSAWDKELTGRKLGDIQIIAFHSYKGGVGRTLSLLAFAKAWVAKQPSHKNKLLIIDSDIEAPGLTWLQNEEIEQHFSYLDLLEIIQRNQFENYASQIAEHIKESTVQISTDKFNTEHYFLPVYRYKEQLFDIYSRPENIVTGINGGYIIPEKITELAKLLGVNAVLIDLRAGISEYSSPFIFDSRIKKYLVTSTSSQSIDGLCMLLQEITKGLEISDDTLLPEILITMIPPTLKSIELSNISSRLMKNYGGADSDYTTVADNIITQLPFSEQLIHLGSLAEIMEVLTGVPFYTKIEERVSTMYVSDRDKVSTISANNRETVIKKIHEFAAKQTTAEGNEKMSVLTTTAINNLKKKYRNEIPCTVVMGAKGAGKTFLYRELLRNKSWYTFCANLENVSVEEENSFLVPAFASKNATEFKELFKQCDIKLKNEISLFEGNEGKWIDNEKELKQFQGISHSYQDWLDFWEKIFVNTINRKIKSFSDLNKRLEEEKKKIVSILDGLEETLQETDGNESEKNAISSLCQDVVRELSIKYDNLGIIIFLRKDLARNSINVNFEQFNQLYGSIELKWSRNEALRLALWLVDQAEPGFYEQKGLPIENVSIDIIDKELQKLWGLKLGKASSNEAYSARWILAALSDFNGQLQARDIIRFLEYATESVGKEAYDDRYIMPAEIKKAVSECSIKKIEEIKQEIRALKPILIKLEKEPGDKTIPFTAETFSLTAAEEKIMKDEGYLKIEDGKYYLPEILRHALKFRYAKGARPKVLSLIKDI